jgi:hypothetical protein
MTSSWTAEVYSNMQQCWHLGRCLRTLATSALTKLDPKLHSRVTRRASGSEGAGRTEVPSTAPRAPAHACRPCPTTTAQVNACTKYTSALHPKLLPASDVPHSCCASTSFDPPSITCLTARTPYVLRQTPAAAEFFLVVKSSLHHRHEQPRLERPPAGAVIRSFAYTVIRLLLATRCRQTMRTMNVLHHRAAEQATRQHRATERRRARGNATEHKPQATTPRPQSTQQ